MRYPLLDPLRGGAAVWVFLHHLVYIFDPLTVPALLARGYFGVPIFFVISGFCMTAAGRRSVRLGEPPGRFLLRRVARIYPPFWAAVVLAVAVYAVLPLLGAPLTPFEADMRVGWRAFGATDWLQIFSLTAGFRAAEELPWTKFGAVNLAFWTLAIEVQFYLVVWAAVCTGRKFYAALALVTIAALPFAVSEVAFSIGWFLPFWPFFALGIGLYAVLEADVGVNSFSAFIAITVTSIGIMMSGLWMAPAAPDGSRMMIAGEFIFSLGLTAILWAGWGRIGSPVGWALGYMYRSSYSLYLLHVPLMILIGHLLVPVLSVGGFGFQAVTVIAVCALVYPFYRWIERPWVSGGASQVVCAPIAPGETSCVRGSVSG